MRRFDPDTVQNCHIYSSIKEEEVFIYWDYFGIFCELGLRLVFTSDGVGVGVVVGVIRVLMT